MKRKAVADIRDEIDPARAPHVATGQVVALFGSAPAKALYAAFEEFNAQHFGGRLAPPLVLITQASASRTLGDYVARDVHGLESRIRIAPAVVKRGPQFARDILLHEMLHAWQVEIDGGADGYRGHGPKFARECNRIGAALGLPPVGVKGRDGLPDCAHWPLNVRPEGYYPTPWMPSRRRKKDVDGTADGEKETDDDRRSAFLAKLRAALVGTDVETLEQIREAVAEELARRR